MNSEIFWSYGSRLVTLLSQSLNVDFCAMLIVMSSLGPSTTFGNDKGQHLLLQCLLNAGTVKWCTPLGFQWSSVPGFLLPLWFPVDGTLTKVRGQVSWATKKILEHFWKLFYSYALCRKPKDTRFLKKDTRFYEVIQNLKVSSLNFWDHYLPIVFSVNFIFVLFLS